MLRKLLTSTLLAVALLAGTLSPAFAQATLNQTTISADITATTTTIPVASASTIVAGHEFFLDGEAMLVLTTPTDTNVAVRRGYDGTAATTHAANTILYTGTPSRFGTRDPLPGQCVPSAVANGALPLVNVRNSMVWHCAATTTGFRWQGLSLVPSFEMGPRTVVAGVAYTILASDYIVALSTTLTGSGGVGVAVKSFTLPSHVGLAGKQIIIKDESGGVGATTNVILVGTIDGTNSSVATVVQLKTPWGAVGLEAGSGGWFTLWCHGGNGSTTCR